MSIRSFGMPVGSFSAMPTSNPLLTLADQSQWLRGGLAVAAAGYALAATLAHLRAHRFTRTSTQASGAVYAMATNGAGTFVAVVPGDSTNLYSSTDGGATWTARAHNMGIAVGPCAIVWTGSRFVAVGNDTSTAVKATTSPDGVTWTLSALASGLAATSVSSVDIAWDGSAVAVAIPGQNTSNTIYTSPTGLSGTWTARTVPGSSSYTAGNSRLGGGALGFVYTFASGNSNNLVYSTDHGATWASGTVSSGAGPAAKPMVGSGFVAIASVGGATSSLVYSTNFTSWAAISASAAFYGNNVIPMAGGGWSAVDSANDLLTTTDGINWTAQVMGDTDATKPGPVASYRIACVGNTSIAMAAANASDYLHYATSTLASANGVGGLSGSGHWRIK